MNIYLKINIKEIIYSKKISVILPINSIVYVENKEKETKNSHKYFVVNKVIVDLEEREVICYLIVNMKWWMYVNAETLTFLLINSGFIPE